MDQMCPPVLGTVGTECTPWYWVQWDKMCPPGVGYCGDQMCPPVLDQMCPLVLGTVGTKSMCPLVLGTVGSPDVSVKGRGLRCGVRGEG